jgi:hypothetical protein
MKLVRQVDHGTLRIHGEHLTGLSFDMCSLSLGTSTRSVFEDCTFSDVRIRKGLVGFPVFKRCRFEDVRADASGLNLLGAAFSECVFVGILKYVTIGLRAESVATYDKAKARSFQADNLKLARTSSFAIDVTAATLDSSCFLGEEIIPFIRCSRDQALVLASDDLYEKLGRLGKAEANPSISSFFFRAGVLPSSRQCVARLGEQALAHLPEIETKLEGEHITLRHFGADGKLEVG